MGDLYLTIFGRIGYNGEKFCEVSGAKARRDRFAGARKQNFVKTFPSKGKIFYILHPAQFRGDAVPSCLLEWVSHWIQIVRSLAEILVEARRSFDKNRCLKGRTSGNACFEITPTR